MSRRAAPAAAIHVLGLGLGLACGPGPADAILSAGSGDGSTHAATGPASGEGDDATTIDTTAEPPGAYEEDDGGTGCTFTCPDPPPLPPSTGGGGGGGFQECHLVEQDCPDGEKCMPWANDGGQRWNATRCSPLAPRTGGLHQTCAVEGSGYSGIDDCGLGNVCTDVDPETNVGTCSAICSAAEGEQWCDDPNEACALIDELVPLCVELCDPLMPACGPGRGCRRAGDVFMCDGVSQGASPPGEACLGDGACMADLVCAYGPAFDCGGEPGQGCCTRFCDATDPGSCAEPGQTCIPWIPVAPPPQWADLGVCAPR